MKMKHTSITTLLTYVRLAYPSFKQYLMTSLNNPLLNVRQRSLLENLKGMCEFFIPVVRFCCASVKIFFERFQ